VWDEVIGLGADLARLGAAAGGRVPARVAFLLDWDSWWALELDSKPSTDVRQRDLLERYYAPLYRDNVPVDLARPDAELSAYALVVAPNLYLLTEAAAANLKGYVEAGGTLVLGFFSGIVDEHDHVRLGGYPALLRRVLGLWVAELDPLPVGATNGLAEPPSAAQTAACDLWCEVVELEGAEAVAVFTADFYAGRPAVTRHAFGRGSAWYVGTRPEPAYLERLLRRVCAEAGVQPVLDAPAGVEAVRRSAPDGRGLLFLLNHNAARVDVTVPTAGTDLLTGAGHAGRLTLRPFGAAVLEA
jgi:beta-galactosidase